MAWFGDKFGDSLNSLKGQITKIASDVLAEDNDSAEETETLQERYKELEAYCASKDLEVKSLQEENLKLNQQFQAEIEYLRNENKRLRRNGDVGPKSFEITDDQIQHICELENQLQHVREEKEHLSQCLEDLQNEHQNNLMEVVKVRDYYKHEMERIAHEYEILKNDYESSKKSVGNDDEIVGLQEEIEKLQIAQLQQVKDEKDRLAEVVKDRDFYKSEMERILRDYELLKSEYENNNKSLGNEDDEISVLREEIGRLQLQVEIGQKEKEEAFLTIKKEIVNHEDLKGKLEKLVNEIKTLSEEKHKTDVENKRIKNENESVSKKIDSLENELQNKNGQIEFLENEVQKLNDKLGSLEKENVLLTEKVKNDEEMAKQMLYFKEFESDTKQLVKKLILQFNLNETVENDEAGYKSLFKSIDNFANFVKRKEEQEASFVKLHENAQEEIQFLRNECQNLQSELLITRQELETMRSASSKTETQPQDYMIQSQTDDVKRLEQEVIRLSNLLESKTEEMNVILNAKVEIEQEMNILKSMASKREAELEKEVLLWKGTIETKEEQFSKLYEEKVQAEEILKSLESHNAELVKKVSDRDRELEEAMQTCSNFEKLCNDLHGIKLDLESQLENAKALVIVKDTQASELKPANDALNLKLQKLEEEVMKWKNALVDLEMEREHILENKNALEIELGELKQEIIKYSEKLSAIQQENAELCQKLANQVSEPKVDVNDSSLTEENNQLKSQIAEMQLRLANIPKIDDQNHIQIQQHRRTKSAADFESSPRGEILDPYAEVERLKNCLQQEQARYRLLQNQHQELKEKESSLRKELERLRIHLVEVEDHYTAEAVESEKTINEFKNKLNSAEEQLKNSSTIYKSANVRANQHLESLQSQIKLMSVQRDDLQAKLSAAEDEVQKHQASLTSLQIVLEQFQQDKEREIEGIVTKYEYQIQLSHKRFKELEMEIDSLKKQLAEAKNGLNAASRLGEQLDKKSQHIAYLEEELRRMQEESKEMESRLSVVNQSNIGKIDKSLIKNLVVGYISSPQADRKSQVLKIMASVLDFNQEERSKLGVDNAATGWLSNLLHPRNDHAQNTQSLSEAFIRFLENESRPQPQLKLLPEQAQADKPGSSRTSPKPSLLLSEFVLPTFNSSHATESSSILKDVLRDS